MRSTLDLLHFWDSDYLSNTYTYLLVMVEHAPYYIPNNNNEDIDWSLLKKALFQGIGNTNWGRFKFLEYQLFDI